jgi:transposase InsO family protein
MEGNAMPWSAETVETQRLEFCVLAEGARDVSFVELCHRYQVAPKTGYKWLARYREFGEVGLVDQSRAPHISPARTPDEMEKLVCDLRKEHEAWGGRKLNGVLVRRGYQGVPAPSTITDILRRHDLLDPPSRAAGGYQRFEAPVPNDLWQMDFKGWFQTGTGRCDPFDVLDDHSRFSLKLSAYGDQKAPTVKWLLTETFDTYGLPYRILCDNGSPWANTNPEHRWTGLGVWLLDLGVGVVHSRVRHPQTLGKDERFHRTLDLEVISTRVRWDSHTQLQQAFDQWRPIYNNERPHDALGGAVPADRYQPSSRSLPASIVPVEYPDGYQVRKVSDRSSIRFKGKDFKIGRAFKGHQVGIIPTTTDGVFNIHYRHQHIRTINLTQSA